MSRPLAKSLFSQSVVCRACKLANASRRTLPRQLSFTARRTADTDTPSPSSSVSPASSAAPRAAQAEPKLSEMPISRPPLPMNTPRAPSNSSRNAVTQPQRNPIAAVSQISEFLSQIPIPAPDDRSSTPSATRAVRTLHRLHVYSTKHNTHITLTRPSKTDPTTPSPIISVSAGNIGFKKAARGTYDAAYQLAAYVLGRVQQEGLLGEIRELEVVLRGFGIGREAVTKAILGSEGRLVRGKIVAVTDSTRLKFGGTRSPKPRRLG